MRGLTLKTRLWILALVPVVGIVGVSAFSVRSAGVVYGDLMARIHLEVALEGIKNDHGIVESVQAVRDGLDQVVGDVLDRLVNPERWRDEIDK